MDVDKVSREFVKSVFSRVQGSTGLGLQPKTIDDYATRIMTLKKQGYLDHINDVDTLYETLRRRYNNPISVLTAIRPAAAFATHLTEQEKSWFSSSQPENVAQKYRSHVTQLNCEVKEARMAKRVQEM